MFVLLFETPSTKSFFLFVIYGTTTKRVERAISDWTNLGINSRAQVAWANKPTTYIHIPVKVK